LSGGFVQPDRSILNLPAADGQGALFGGQGTFRCKTLTVMMKKNSASPRKDYACLEQVVGCKWSVSVLMSVRSGIDRPGALEKAIAGISTKVLSERLRKLTAYGLLHKQKFPETPPRTVYTLTARGAKLVSIIEQLHELDSRKS
jgi:DNA-binding HxlR family transcriptional regulator